MYCDKCVNPCVLQLNQYINSNSFESNRSYKYVENAETKLFFMWLLTEYLNHRSHDRRRGDVLLECIIITDCNNKSTYSTITSSNNIKTSRYP